VARWSRCCGVSEAARSADDSAGELSPGNAPLVSRVADICRALDRPVATVEETEKILGLAPAA
jgi:uncharacterized protein (DUF849 family)